MKKYFLIIIICFSYLNLFSEKKPKLVVGIVVDQMRFDFIERFWNDFGPKLGAKLGPSWHQNRRTWGYQDDVKKSLKNWRRGGTQVAAGNRSAGP